jgi:16S rRNA (adenine1518-N6/adenine1519-N6)-dimethyltransferase
MRAKKSLGQNFLSNKVVLNSMIKAGNLKEGDTVLEIGPGKGSLTKALLATGNKVIAIEKDHRLIPLLNEKFKKDIETGSLSLIEGDFLEIDTEKILNRDAFVVIANIPYYITGILLRKFFAETHIPKKIVLMVQKEVADRIVARDKKESVLSLSVKLYGTPKIIQKVSKKLFSPVPKVDSAILSIETNPNKKLSPEKEARFFFVIKKAFNQKRKTVGSTLRNITANYPNIFSEAGISPTERPEDIDLPRWLTFIDRLSQHAQ